MITADRQNCANQAKHVGVMHQKPGFWLDLLEALRLPCGIAGYTQEFIGSSGRHFVSANWFPISFLRDQTMRRSTWKQYVSTIKSKTFRSTFLGHAKRLYSVLAVRRWRMQQYHWTAVICCQNPLNQSLLTSPVYLSASEQDTLASTSALGDP